MCSCCLLSQSPLLSHSRSYHGRPLQLTNEFGNILAEPVLATNVSVKLLLHGGLRFRNEPGAPSASSNVVSREVGNVTASSELTFEFGIRPGGALGGGGGGGGDTRAVAIAVIVSP